MSQAPQTPDTQGAALTPLMRALIKNRKQLRIALFGVAGLLAIIPLWMLGVYRTGVLLRPAWLYSLSAWLIVQVLAFIDLSQPNEDEASQAAKLRLEMMLLGGLIGLATTLLGFVLPFTYYSAEITAGLESWRANPRAIIWTSLAIFGGLALMFASLQLGRGMERQNQHVRRLIYGFNAVLTGLLLIAVLALPNVLAYADPFTRFFGRSFDWTKSGVNVVDVKTRNLLADLSEPVKVYALLPPNHPITLDTQTLLNNCRSLTNKFTWEQINPNALENRERINGFREKYSISDPTGLLVIVGTESEKTRPDFAFIKFRDMFDVGGGRTYTFKGENALYNTLVSLIEGKMVVYFTTGHGELAPDDMPERMPGMPPRPQAGGLSTLKRRLTERKGVEVKTLSLGQAAKKVPDDASVVVIVRPKQEFSKAAVDALRAYLQRSAVTKKVKDKDGREKDEETVTAGRLMVLLEPIIDKGPSGAVMARNGLEGLLAEYNVRLGNERVISVGAQNPVEVLCWTPEESNNPIAKAFHPSARSRTIFLFHDVRSVSPLADKGPGGGKAVDRIMEAPPGDPFYVCLEKNLEADPQAVQRQVLAGLRKRDEAAINKLAQDPISVAVAVSDSSGPPGMPRDAAHGGQFKDSPKMVVFGAAEWVSEEGLSGRGAATRMDLFNSCLAWLREKSGIGISSIEDKKREAYDLQIPQQEVGKLTYLPLALMLLGVIGLGTGVWVVRRR